jgi:hypothetical protein
MQDQGIEAPDTVEEGSTSTIEIHCPGSTSILIVDSGSGESVTVTVGADNKARFEPFPGSRTGSTLMIVDQDDPDKSAFISVVSPTSA